MQGLEALARTAGADVPPGDALRAIVALRGLLDALEERHVDHALAAGWSWREIGAALEMTKQAAHRRHAARNRAGRQTPLPGLRPEPEGGSLIVSGEARTAVEYAREESRALGAASVEADHLLLGLLRDEAGLAARALASLGVELTRARDLVAARQGGAPRREPGPRDRPPVSPELRLVFEQALREAVRLGHGHLGVEHLLLALARREREFAGGLLQALGAPPAAVGERTLELLDHGP
jgi:hypothetical protein